MNKNVIIIFVIGLISCSQKESKNKNSNDSSTVKLTDNQSQVSRATGTYDSCNNLDKDYYKRIEFPHYYLDSIDDNFNFLSDDLLDFTECDNFIFKNKQQDISYKYISLQDTTNFYIVVGYKQQLGENHFFICSISKNNELLDYKIEMIGGDDTSSRDNVLIDGKIMNMRERKRKLEFLKGGYTAIYKQFYSLRDSVGSKEVIEVGEQVYITYRLNDSGKFVKVDDKSFAKKYTDLKYWY